jgi:hypothetical protein
MFVNLTRLKVPEIRKLAKTYNKLNLIPHPSTLKKADLIAYLKERLETNKKGHVNIDKPELQRSIKKAIDRIKKEDEEAKQNLEKTFQEIEKDTRMKQKQKVEPEPTYRDTLTKEQRDEQDRRMKHLIETGEFLFEEQPERKKTKEDKEHDKRIREAAKAIEEEREKEREARTKRNQEIMKKVRENIKKKVEGREKPKLETTRADELLKNLKKRNLQRVKAQRILKEAQDYLAEEKRSKKTQKKLTDEQQNFIENFEVLIDNGNKFKELEELIDNKEEFNELNKDVQEEIMNEYNRLDLGLKIEDFRLTDNQIEDYIKLYNYRTIGLLIVNYLFKNEVPDSEIPFEKIKDFEQKYKKLIFMSTPEIPQLMFGGLLPYLRNLVKSGPDNMKAEYKKAFQELENIYTLSGVV